MEQRQQELQKRMQLQLQHLQHDTLAAVVVERSVDGEMAVNVEDAVIGCHGHSCHAVMMSPNLRLSHDHWDIHHQV